MKNIIKIIALSSIIPLSVFAANQEQNIDPDNQKQINESKEVKKEKKIGFSERLDIISDERERLKEISKLRKDYNIQSLNQNYIRLSDYSEYVKGMMREASYNINFLVENYDNKKAISENLENISLNAICLSLVLEDETPVVFSVLQSTIISENSKEMDRFYKANDLINRIEIENETKTITKEEYKIRCLDMYSDEITKKK